MLPSSDLGSLLKTLAASQRFANDAIYHRFRARIDEGQFTRTENNRSHFCVYFLPINSKTRQVFLIHHKKANLWLSPGGHIDPGETPYETLNREIEEELGLTHFFQTTPEPFFCDIVDIDNAVQPCKAHHDLWYTMETDGSNFNVDLTEFHDAKWLTITEARKIVTDPGNLIALEKIEKTWD